MDEDSEGSADLRFASKAVTDWNRRSCVVSEDPLKLARPASSPNSSSGGARNSVGPRSRCRQAPHLGRVSTHPRDRLLFGLLCDMAVTAIKAEGADKPRVLVPAEGAVSDEAFTSCPCLHWPS